MVQGWSSGSHGRDFLVLPQTDHVILEMVGDPRVEFASTYHRTKEGCVWLYDRSA